MTVARTSDVSLGADRVDDPRGGHEAVAPPSLVARYEAISLAYEGRRTDAVLRAVDILLVTVALVVLAPLILALAFALLVVAGRPILYRGTRVGRFGRIFSMYKFRTLRPDAETRLGPYYGEELTRRTAEETVPLGAGIRALHLDEIPQLFNVLKGDMSLVGPRPIRPAFLEELCARVPQYWQRLVVRPGVTGFAQTRITREDAWTYKLAHDLEYIADRSLGLYFRVLLATAARVASRAFAALARALRSGLRHLRRASAR